MVSRWGGKEQCITSGRTLVLSTNLVRSESSKVVFSTVGNGDDESFSRYEDLEWLRERLDMLISFACLAYDGLIGRFGEGFSK